MERAGRGGRGLLATAVRVIVFLAALSTPVASRAELGSWVMARAEQVAPGLRYSELRRGEVARSSRIDVVVGSSAQQAQADSLVWAVVERGFEPVVLYESGRYEIRIAGLADRVEAERARALLADSPLGAGAEVVEGGHDLASANGPWVVHLLDADAAAVDVRAAHARDAAFGLETTSAIALRHGALAAVNGGFYLPEGELPGDSAGTLVLGGRLVSEPDRGRATVGFLRAEGRVQALFGRPTFCGVATLASGDQIVIDGIDRWRGQSEAILYTPAFHGSTLTGPGGIEAVVVGGRVVAVRAGVGGTTIPEQGYVLSLGPARAGEDGVELRVGESVAIELRLRPRAGDPAERWEGAESALSAGPLLLAGGVAVARPELEAISQVFSRARHPRTALGVRADGTLLFVAVEGRQPARSVGMSIAELVELLLDLGAVDAINLDGGGSTAMVIRGELISTPSDRDGERANGDALLILAAP